MKPRAKALSSGIASGAIIALGALLLGGTTVAAAGSTADAAGKKKKKSDKCDPDTEMIIDDSGSNADTDLLLPGNPAGNPAVPGGFRGEFGRQYVSYPLNQGDTLGAVKFDHAAYSMFSPLKITGANIVNTMNPQFGALSANGGTDYDAGFTQGNLENPKANNRIFLSDGLASPPTQHLNPKIRTHVIGYGPDITTDPNAVSLLSSIAAQTGGEVYFSPDASNIGTFVAQISARQHCQSVLTFNDSFVAVGQEFVHTFKAKGKNSDVAITWPTAGAQIDGGAGSQPFVSVSGGNAQVAKAKTTRKAQGATFTTFRIKGLKNKKKVKLTLKAVVLPAGTAVPATTNVVR